MAGSVGRRGHTKEDSGKELVVLGKVTSLWGKKGSVGQMASLVPTGRCQADWVKVTCLGEAEAAVGSGRKSWLADVGLGTLDSHLGPVVSFLNRSSF